MSSDPKLDRDLAYLYALNGKGIKLGLSRIRRLLDEIGNPQRQLRTIHVAGTNGKGSTCAIIASILQAYGYRVGLFTSPHLVRFNERIRIDSRKIGDETLARLMREIRPLTEKLDTTFFETTTAMALRYFRDQKVDYAVLETGLGGRFDATNIVVPILSVITPIGKDHEQQLGATLRQITYEKAGIIKADVACISARQRPGVRKILQEAATRNGSPFIYGPEHIHLKTRGITIDRQVLDIDIDKGRLKAVRYPLIGSHQQQNLQTALAAVTLIPGLAFSEANYRQGVENVIWPGRLQLLSRKPLVFYDVGHNMHGMWQIVRTLRKLLPQRTIHALVVLGRRKKFQTLNTLLKILSGRIYVSEIPNGKSAPADRIAASLERTIDKDRIRVNARFPELLSTIMESISADEVLLIVGSHYIAPWIYPHFEINI